MSLITFEVNSRLSHPATMAQAYVGSSALKEPPVAVIDSGVSLPNVTSEIPQAKPQVSPEIVHEVPQLTLIDKIVKNPVLNRLGNDLLGVVFPTIATEFALRGVKRGIEMTTVMASYVATTFVVPTALMPVWNKMATKEHALPSELTRLHEIGFEDLLQDQDIKVFKDKLQELEGEEKLNKFLANVDDKDAALKTLRSKLIKAKSGAIKKNVFLTGLFANLVYWFKNWFAKNVLGVTGFTGELNVLDEGQMARNSDTYENNKHFLFGGAMLSYIAGSHLFSSAIGKAAESTPQDVKGNPALSFMRDNIDTFDVQDGRFPKRGNLFGMYLTGGVFSYLFASRSITELIENIIRLAIWTPMALVGDSYIKNASATKMDKNQGTSLMGTDRTNRKGVKSLDVLHKELYTAKVDHDEDRVDLLEKSIEARKKMDLTSLIQNAVLMGAGLTAFNALFSNWRLKNGIGVS